MGAGSGDVRRRSAALGQHHERACRCRLGTLARIVASGETIYRAKLLFAEAERRVRTCWQPFHDTLAALIAADPRPVRRLPADRLPFDALARPCRPVRRRSRPTSCLATRTARPARRGRCDWWRTCCRELGYSVRRNDPYAGGYITRHYGRPREGVHALQIEIARELYMDEGNIERLPGFAAVQAAMTRFIAGLASNAGAGGADPGPPAKQPAKKMAALAAPPSLGRKRPRKQTARPGAALLRCTI